MPSSRAVVLSIALLAAPGRLVASPVCSAPSTSFESLLEGHPGAPTRLERSAVDTGYVTVPGGRLYYEAQGSGDPLVLVHGNAGDRRHWDLQVPALSRRFRVIRYDVRGFGKSSVPKLDAHMSSADMFDVAQFPNASFKSTSVKVLGKDHLAVAGDLTIHGVTKPATFDVTINSTAPNAMRKTRQVGMDAHATIKRSDFGVTFSLPGVADEVKLAISMEAGEPRKAPADAAPAAKPEAAPAAAPAATPAAAGKGG